MAHSQHLFEGASHERNCISHTHTHTLALRHNAIVLGGQVFLGDLVGREVERMGGASSHGNQADPPEQSSGTFVLDDGLESSAKSRIGHLRREHHHTGLEEEVS